MDRTGSGVIVLVQMRPKVIYGPNRSCFSTASRDATSRSVLERHVSPWINAGTFRDFQRATLEDFSSSCEKREDHLAKSRLLQLIAGT